MIKSGGNRLVYFLFGITVGLLAGAGFFIFKIDEYISRLSLFNQQTSDTLLVEETKQSDGQKKSTASFRSSDTKELPLKADSFSVNVQNTDSFFADSLFKGMDKRDELIEVKKDELIEVREMEVSGVQSPPKTGKDSALQNISGIREEKGGQARMTVEFWVSPINYRGYKMTRNKLVVFGLNAAEPSGLLRTTQALYLKQGDVYYRLEPAADFRPLEQHAEPE